MSHASCIIRFAFLASLLFGTELFANGTILLKDSFDREELSTRWEKGQCGGPGSGTVVLERKTPNDENFVLTLKQNTPPGGVQAKSALISLNSSDSIRISFQAIGQGSLFAAFYGNKDGKTIRIAEDRIRIWNQGKWIRITRNLKVPRQADRLRLSFVVWSNQPALRIDDLIVLGIKETRSSIPVEILPVTPLSFRERSEYHPQPPPARSVAIRNSVFTKDGHPFFLIGDGNSYPAQYWLNRIQGISVIDLYHSAWGGAHRLQYTKTPTKLTIAFPGWFGAPFYTMIQEASRYGLISAAGCGTGVDRWSSLAGMSGNYSAINEFFIRGNHFYMIDPHTENGRKWIDAQRGNSLRYLQPSSLLAYELVREIGYMPTHPRVIAGFRSWAKKKYGSLKEACRVWKRNFDRWEAVIPPHLEHLRVLDFPHRKEGIEKVRATNMYYDWLQFCQDDLTEGFRHEIKLLRRWYAGPVTSDIRGDMHWADGYMASDPDKLNELHDVRYLHRGFATNIFGEKPADEKDVFRAIESTPYTISFFRNAGSQPLFNSECIVSKVTPPGTNLNVMAQRDLGQLHGQWKFRLDLNNQGLRQGWQKAVCKDDGWDVMTVPGIWDGPGKYHDKKGVAWYRKTFHLAKEYGADFLDGSRVFYLYGKGIAQSGDIYVNGFHAGTVKGYDTPYKIDVGRFLRFGKENTIAVRVDGSGFHNGLREYIHLLPQDMLNESIDFGEKQYEELLWSYLIEGLNGVFLWNWNRVFRPYMARLSKEMETFSPIVLEEARNKKSKIAFLHSWTFLRGLVVPQGDGEMHKRIFSAYSAFLFRGFNPDILSEGAFRKITSQEYKLLVVPYMEIVQPETYEHFKRYVLSGGTAILTESSLRRTFHRYENTDLEEFALRGAKRMPDGSLNKKIGRGQVVFLPGEKTMKEWIAASAPYLPAPEVEFRVKRNAEFPYIQARIVGGENHRLLYLHNWGGLTQTVTVKLPDAVASWNRRHVSGEFSHDGRETTVRVPSCSVAVLLLEKTGAVPLKRKTVSPVIQSILSRLIELDRNGDGKRPSVLFMNDLLRSKIPVGRSLVPVLTDLLDRNGFETQSLPEKEWTEQNLSRHKMVFLLEDFSRGFSPIQKKLTQNLLEYVRNGGSLFLVSNTGYLVNVLASNLNEIGKTLNLRCSEYREREARDPAHCGFGDPLQILSETIAENSPLTKGVRRIQFYTVRPMTFTGKSPLKGIVFSNASDQIRKNEPVIAAGEYGKGKIVLAADAMWLLPFRVEEADNLTLLTNILEYLLNISVPGNFRKEYRSSMFISLKKVKESDADNTP